MLQTELKFPFVCLVAKHLDSMAVWKVIFELTSVIVVDVLSLQGPSTITHAILPLSAVLRSILASLQTNSVPASVFHFAFIDRQGSSALHLNHTTD